MLCDNFPATSGTNCYRRMSMPSSRSLAFIRLHSQRWRRRLIFVGGGLVVGLLAVGLAVASDAVQRVFQICLARWPYMPLVVTPLGFGLAVLLVVRVFPNTQGSGIPQAIAARALHDQEARARLVGLRVALGKIVLTLFGLLVGASTGREGPTVQVGASVMFLIGRITPRRQPGLILAGAAAGVAAAFNAPLAGIVFAIEEMSRSFEVRASGLIIAGVILAGLVAQAILGDYTYFGFTSAALPIGTAWMAVPICGVIGGFSGAFFSRILVAVPDALPGRALIRRHPVIFAALCGLGVALCGLAGGGQIFGTGYRVGPRCAAPYWNRAFGLCAAEIAGNGLIVDSGGAGRHLFALAVSGGGHRRRCGALLSSCPARTHRAFGYGGLFHRRGARAHHRLCHRIGDDGRSRHAGGSNGHRSDRRILRSNGES